MDSPVCAARSARANRLPSQPRGFTLLEVLVALAVLSVALFSVVTVAAQRAETLHQLQQRQLALQVADKVLNAYLHHRLPVSSGQRLGGVQKNGPYRWHWRIVRENTPNPRIFRIRAQVSEDASFEYLAAELTGFSPP